MFSIDSKVVVVTARQFWNSLFGGGEVKRAYSFDLNGEKIIIIDGVGKLYNKKITGLAIEQNSDSFQIVFLIDYDGGWAREKKLAQVLKELRIPKIYHNQIIVA